MSVKRRVVKTLSDLGLIEVAHEMRGLASLAKPATFIKSARFRLQGAPDGLPVPPGRLIYLVAGTYDVDWFLTLGQRGSDAIRDTLRGNKIDIHSFGAMLDFGCGCGRVLRCFADLDRVAVHGCDYNPRLTDWCARALSFAKVRTNQLSPPLPYESGMFDFVYALSVFTHLGQDLQFAWMDEMRRVIKPGGYLYMTAHGDSYLPRLDNDERARYQADEIVIRRQHLAGKNVCNAYCSQRYVRKHLTRGCEVVDFIPEGANGNPTQDVYLMRFAG